MRKQMILVVLLALYLAACQPKPTQSASDAHSGTLTEESTAVDGQSTQANSPTDTGEVVETSSQLTEDID